MLGVIYAVEIVSVYVNVNLNVTVISNVQVFHHLYWNMINCNRVSEDDSSSENASSDTGSLSSSDDEIGYISRKPCVISDSSDDSNI